MTIASILAIITMNIIVTTITTIITTITTITTIITITRHAGYTEPTPIQSQGWSLALTGQVDKQTHEY